MNRQFIAWVLINIWSSLSNIVVNGGVCDEFWRPKINTGDSLLLSNQNVSSLTVRNNNDHNTSIICPVGCKCRWYVFPDSRRSTFVICINSNLTKLPFLSNNTGEFIFRYNDHMDTIPNNTFINNSIMLLLEISHCNITHLQSDSFKGLRDLQYLRIFYNKIRYTDAAIPPHVFQDLTSLRTLHMQQSLPDLDNNETYPVDAWMNLLNLTQLVIDGFPNINFKKEMSNLTNLIMLEFRGDSGRCQMDYVSKDMFKSLPQINFLSLRDCGIKNVEKGSFASLRSLTGLDLSNNTELEWRNLRNITYGLDQTKIQLLNLTSIHSYVGDCTQLQVTDVEYLHQTKLKALILDSNRLSYMTPSAALYIPRALQCFSLKRNMVLVGPYMVIIQYFGVLNKLKILVLSEQHQNPPIVKLLPSKVENLESRKQYILQLLRQKRAINERQTVLGKDLNRKRSNNEQFMTNNFNKSAIMNKPTLSALSFISNSTDTVADNNTIIKGDKLNKHLVIQDLPKELLTSLSTRKPRVCANCQQTLSLNSSFQIPEHLEFLDMSDMKIRFQLNKGFCLCAPNNLKTLKLNRNIFYDWQGPFHGFDNLTSVDVSWNSCENLSLTLFQNMPNIDYLNLSRNFLGYPLAKDRNGQLFSNLPKLLNLDLSNNKLRYMPPKLFEGLTGLINLYLNHNLLVDFKVKIAKMKWLKSIDLSNNLLESISESTRKTLDHHAATGAIVLYLANNNLTCSCKTIDFVKWLSETTVELPDFDLYQCKYENGSIVKLLSRSNTVEIYSQLSKECANYLVLILTTSAAVLVTITLIIGGLLYRFRWDLRYMYYSAKFRVMGYTPVNVEDGEYRRDVFVSYADEDRGFVRNHVVKELEKNRGLKLLVHNRDFLAGNYVTENIMKAITTSRKTLIIMTRDFLKSNWCRYEMNMARMEGIKTGRDVICVLMKEEVPNTGLPIEIIDVIRNQTFAEFPHGEEHQQQFWDGLRDSLVA